MKKWKFSDNKMNRFRAFRHLLPCFGESIWSVCDCDPDPIKRFDEWTPLLAFNDHFSGESGYPIPPLIFFRHLFQKNFWDSGVFRTWKRGPLTRSKVLQFLYFAHVFYFCKKVTWLLNTRISTFQVIIFQYILKECPEGRPLNAPLLYGNWRIVGISKFVRSKQTPVRHVILYTYLPIFL